MPEQIRVNIKHRVRNAAIRHEERDGRSVIVVPSVVAKFNTVLNEIFYPEDELRASYQQINGLPAPLGHPVVNGQYVASRSPEAINRYWAGAWNESARIDGDVIRADKIIDVETANESERGRRLMQAIDGGEPISTSTGLLMERDEAPEGTGAKWVGRNFAFDHDAILLDEAPAIGTEQGVGMLVNGEKVEVVESELNVDDDMLTMMAWEMVEQNEYSKKRKRNESLVEKVKNAFRSAFSAAVLEEEAPGLNVNSDEDHQMTPEEMQAALDQQAETLTAAFNAKLDETVKPLQERIDAMNADRDAAVKAEHDAAVEAVVNAKLMDKEEAEPMPTAALNALVKASKKAAPLATGLASNSADESIFDTLPE